MNNLLNPSLTLFTAVFIEPFFHENSRVSMLNVICQYLNNLHQCSCSQAKDRLKMIRSVAWLYFEKNVRPGKKTVTCTLTSINMVTTQCAKQRTCFGQSGVALQYIM